MDSHTDDMSQYLEFLHYHKGLGLEILLRRILFIRIRELLSSGTAFGSNSVTHRGKMICLLSVVSRN